MQLSVPIADLHAAPGFLDSIRDAAAALDVARAAELYAFLPAGTAFDLRGDELIITYPDPGKARLGEAADLFERGAKRAREGDYDKAIQQFERGLAISALSVTARRDLAMARMAKGETDGTDAELRRLLLLAPADPWAWVILGNLNFRRNFPLAERYFRRAVELAPNDPYAWNGMGAMYSEKHDYPKAIVAFESAIKTNPTFVNAHFGLSVALAKSGERRKAFAVLERMFDSAAAGDTRALPTIEQARRFFLELAQQLAVETVEVAEAEVETLSRDAERISGFSVRFETAESGALTTAWTEMAWRYGRDHHVIRVSSSVDPVVSLHLRAHELCHVIMEAEARNAGANRSFSTDESSYQHAREELATELAPLQRALPPAKAEEFLARIFKGLMAQLFNLPLDMVIERRLADHHRALRYAQIVSVSRLLEEAVKGCTSPEIIRVVPRRILHASRYLNACYATFVDRQFQGAFSATLPYAQMGALERGTRLFCIWDQSGQNLGPGTEYDLVDAMAADLRLRDWFAWIKDAGVMAPAGRPEGTTNPGLLATKSPAAFAYFLEILKRFDAMTPETIKQVAVEAALKGQDGLNYASPDKAYRLPTYGPDLLSGLEVMCVMFAGFQRIGPQHDIGIDLHDAYQQALAIHEAQKGGGE
jgi:tetratricopeptide (TPR) repeat protein